MHLTIKHGLLILNQNQSIATAQVLQHYDWIFYMQYKNLP